MSWQASGRPAGQPSRRTLHVGTWLQKTPGVRCCSTSPSGPPRRSPAGHVGEPGHPARGAVVTRAILCAPVCPSASVSQSAGSSARTACRSTPSRATGLATHFNLHKLPHGTKRAHLAALAEADMRAATTAVLDDEELFRELAREEGCYGQERSSADGAIRVRHFAGGNVHPDGAPPPRPTRSATSTRRSRQQAEFATPLTSRLTSRSATVHPALEKLPDQLVKAPVRAGMAGVVADKRRGWYHPAAAAGTLLAKRELR